MSRARDASFAVRLALFVACSAAAACQPAPNDPPKPPANPGLYTPGSALGVVPTDAATGFGTVNERGPASDGCRAMFGAPGTAGNLMIAFKTQVVGQAWQPANVGAVWIEWVDPTDPDNFMKDRYVRTTERWADLRSESLETWITRQCSTNDVTKDADVVSGATRPDHNAPHASTWNGKDLTGQVMPDGEYKLFIELTEYEEQGPIDSYTFTKGPMAWTMNMPDGPTHTGLVLTWTPGGGLGGPPGL